MSDQDGLGKGSLPRGSLSNQLEGLFIGHTLSPAQRRISRYVVENATEAAYLNSSELAEVVGVSQASVTRLANSVGFSGYSQMQRVIRRLIQDTITVSEEYSTKFQRAIQTEIDNLTALKSSLHNESSIRAIAESVIESPCLVVMGQRMTSHLATYFAQHAAKVLPDVRTVTTYGSPAVDTLVQASQRGGKEIILFLSPRLPAELLTHLRLARDLGFRVHAVADPDLPSAAAAYCDSIIVAPAGKSLVFDTHAAHMMIGSILLEAITDAASDETRRRLEFYEDVLKTHEVFISD